MIARHAAERVPVCRITAVLCFLAAYALLQTDPSAGQAKYTFQV